MNQNIVKSVKNSRPWGIILLLLAAAGLRILFACTYRGFEADTNCFFSWANMLWENLNADNKVSLFVRYIDIETGNYETKIINKNA